MLSVGLRGQNWLLFVIIIIIITVIIIIIIIVVFVGGEREDFVYIGRRHLISIFIRGPQVVRS